MNKTAASQTFPCKSCGKAKKYEGAFGRCADCFRAMVSGCTVPTDD